MKGKSRKEVRNLVSLSLGITASQLALILIGMSDTVMMGRISRSGLAAGTLVSSFYNLGLLFCMGMIIPIAVQLGASKYKDSEEKRISITATYYRTSLVLAVLTILFLILAVYINMYVGKDPEMMKIARKYAIGIIPGIIPWVLFYLIRNILLSYQKVKFTTVLAVVSIIINVLLNWIFMYGAGPFKGMGITGCAAATSVTNWCIFLIAYLFLRHDKRFIPSWKQIFARDGEYTKETIQLGIPTGLVFFSEYLIFSFGNSLLSSLSTSAVVAFGIAVSWLNLLYMFPVALSQVITEPLSRFFAINKMDKVRELSRASLFIVLIYNAASVVSILVFKRQMIYFIMGANMTTGLYQLAENYMYLIAAVIFLYNFIVVLSGILRGFGDVKTPLLMIFIMYWGIGIGGTMILTHFTGVYGVPLGMCLGFLLTCAGVFSTYRKKTRRV